MARYQVSYYVVFVVFATFSILLMLFMSANTAKNGYLDPLFLRSRPVLHPVIAIEPPLTDHPITPGASIVSIPYGPYNTTAHSMGTKDVILDGQKPCTNCYIVAMQAILQDDFGVEIFPDSGVILHHIIFLNHAREDPVCPQMPGERFYGGGYERQTRRWNSGGLWGYKVDEDDEWAIVIKVANDADVDITVQVVVRFEVVSAASTEGRDYRGVAAVWLDLTGCGHAGVDVKSTVDAFEYRTPDWKSSIEGEIVDITGHMHDGGVNMTGYRNGHPICTSVQTYDNQASQKHIVAAGVCKHAGRVRKGDIFWADAKYDPIEHDLWMHNGEPEQVMGAMGVYIGLTQ